MNPYPAPVIRAMRLTGAGLAIAGLAVLGMVLHQRSEIKLPRYAAVPSFSLTERSGRTVTNADLAGEIWVASFIYTTCPGPCPVITANVARLQQAYAADPQVRFVSFTVDAQDDAPEVLRAYAAARGADPDRWWFLTGRPETVDDLVEHGFFQAVVDNHGKKLDAGQYLVTHGTQFALVDPQGYIRGFYDGLGGDGNAALRAAIGALERQSF